MISTDPAHSLGDVLDQKVSGGEPTPVLGMENLWAMEVDSAKALDKFKELFKDLDLNALTEQFGANLDLGLDEITGLLENPPPGIDELIALADVVQLTNAADGRKFDRIVIDTAPTGHTLRLLSFPDFLDSFLGKIIKFQVRLSGLLNTLGGLFGGGAKEGKKTMSVEEAFKKIEAAKERVRLPLIATTLCLLMFDGIRRIFLTWTVYHLCCRWYNCASYSVTAMRPSSAS